MSANVSASTPLGEITDNRVVANRANAQKSTGPKTAKGKAAVGLNSVRHGIQAVFPVLPGESPHVWRRFKAGMFVSLAPVGMVELTLAERITLTGWRLRRVTRFETESMRQALAQADERLEQRLWRELDGGGTSSTEDVLARAYQAAQEAAAVQAAFDKYLQGPDTARLTNEEASGILTQAFAVSGRARWPDDGWPPRQPGFTGWTVALVRSSMESLNRTRAFRDLGQFTRTVGARIETNLREAVNRPTEIERKRLENRRAHQMPDAATCERIQRYETHLSRQFHRDLHELQRLQAMRLGQPVDKSIAIDIDVTGGSKAD